MKPRRINLVWLALAAVSTLSQPNALSLGQRLASAAVERTSHVVRYDPAYVRIPYPGGDVPQDTGVCTDEIVRVYRTIGIDLQKEVHEDILANPASYRLTRQADANIDHRRVPNLMVFFRAHGDVLATTDRAADYRPGEIITWKLTYGHHIGMVVNRYDPSSGRPLVVHNIGEGPKMEDVLFAWPISGHFRYPGTAK